MLQVATSLSQWIEFIGGPYDGRWQSYQSPTEKLPADVIWLVTQDAVRQLDRLRPVKPARGSVLDSVALYGLDVSCEMPKYRYAGSIGPRAFSEAMRHLERLK